MSFLEKIGFVETEEQEQEQEQEQGHLASVPKGSTSHKLPSYRSTSPGGSRTSSSSCRGLSRAPTRPTVSSCPSISILTRTTATKPLAAAMAGVSAPWSPPNTRATPATATVCPSALQSSCVAPRRTYSSSWLGYRIHDDLRVVTTRIPAASAVKVLPSVCVRRHIEGLLTCGAAQSRRSRLKGVTGRGNHLSSRVIGEANTHM